LSGDKTRVAQALKTYGEHGNIVCHPTLDEAKAELIVQWAQQVTRYPEKSALVLAYTNRDVFELNAKARDYLKATGKVAATEYPVQTERGARQFSEGDRIMFLRNEKSMNVKNGSLGTVVKMHDRSMTVRLDTGPVVAFDTGKYRDIDYGYAATIHKTQGTTVDRSFVLATQHFDKHTTYVSLSRHRDDVTLYYSEDHFKDFKELKDLCGRERPKHLAADFAVCRGIGSAAELHASRTIEGVYSRDAEVDGKKYVVIEDFENKRQYMVPFKKEYAQYFFRRVQYDGTTLQYAPQKSPIEKTLDRTKELPGKER
jgi:hypothetical protein